MPVGNETAHQIDGLTVQGGLALRNGNDADVAYIASDLEGGVLLNGVSPFSLTFPPRGVGVEIPAPRVLCATAVAVTSGTIRWTQFVAPRNAVVSTVEHCTGSTAAGATPTTVKYAVYSVAEDGAVTLLAATANDTTLLAAANTPYPKALSAPVTLAAGSTYAVGLLVVTGAATPTIFGPASLASGQAGTGRFRVAATRGSETDFQASYTNAQLTASATGQWSYLS